MGSTYFLAELKRFKVEEFSWLYTIIVLGIGAYLTWAGFTG
jgi:hypothetical protein